jgi:hypothetical protein
MLHFKPAASESLGQGGHQILIEFKRENAIESLEKGFGQSAMAGTYLEDSPRPILQCRHNLLGNRSVNQEVLAESTSLWSTHP